MRFWLILLQLAGFCLLISIFGDGDVTPSSLVENVGNVVAGILFAVFVLILQALSLLLTGTIATGGLSQVTVLLPLFLGFVCAVLAGYRELWWLRWIGFVLTLGVGLRFVEVGKDIFSMEALTALYFLAQAVLFYLLPPKGDAERIRKSATMLHPVLGVIGLGLGILAFITSKSGIGTIILTVLFYAVAFFLHFIVSKTIQLQPKPLIKTALALALTLAGLNALFTERPIMAGPLLLSWLSIALYVEALALSKFRVDVPYAGWRHQVLKAAKFLIVSGIVLFVIYFILAVLAIFKYVSYQIAIY